MRLYKLVFNICLVIVLVGVLATSCSATIKLELAGGANFPTADFNDYWGIGLGGDVTLLFELNPFFSAGVNLAYNNNPFDSDTYEKQQNLGSNYSVTGGDASVFSACGELRAHTGAMDKATFFGGLGIGLFNSSFKDIKPSVGKIIELESENQLGGYLHAGLAMSVSPNVLLGLKGQINFFKNEEVSVLNIGEMMSYFSLKAVTIVEF